MRPGAAAAEVPQVSAPALGMTLAAFAALSFLLCVLLGAVSPDWGLHRPWLQFYLGLTGFDLRSIVLGLAQSLVYGGHAGVLTGLLFNFFSRRLG
ncbi:hypothetical protein QNA08_16720 [Chelatococcus sp. SYSU_G07232]|uniref:Uncharacterized protein n=2 Tax=Chelatococcus albus TaxID=3047466 RepID=A0ABT7ALC1_9HYPH|nr:hypothetical protein [Chelatococcus sp. SYSU_G07232]MDJ1159865.1 hypothetical protein [Chelatococcus sp. SYSU_G07232]